VKRARSVKVIIVLLGNPFQMYLNSLSFIVYYSFSVLYDDKFYCQRKMDGDREQVYWGKGRGG